MVDIVFLFKTNQFSGTLVSSDEGEMEWVERKDINKLSVVNDFGDLLKVIDADKLTEFQYVIDKNEWIAITK